MRYFEKWTPNMSYWLGYIWADGCIRYQKGAYNLRLGIVSSDDYIIFDFLKEIESHHKVLKTPETISKYRKASAFTSVAVCGERFVRPLVKIHGVLQNKSYLDCEFPNVPDRFLPHFVRGYFDGDGSLVKTNQGYCKISIIGTKKFLTGLEKAINKNTGLPVPLLKKSSPSNKIVMVLEWCRREQVLAFLKFIYPKGEYPYLRRKRSSYEALLPTLEEHWNNFGIGPRKGQWRLRLGHDVFVRYFKNKKDALIARSKILGNVDFRLKDELKITKTNAKKIRFRRQFLDRIENKLAKS